MVSIIEESKKSRQNGLFGFWRNKKFVYGLLALAIIGGGTWYFISGKGSKTAETVQAPKEWTVKKDDITVSVEADGKVWLKTAWN